MRKELIIQIRSSACYPVPAGPYLWKPLNAFPDSTGWWSWSMALTLSQGTNATHGITCSSVQCRGMDWSHGCAALPWLASKSWWDTEWQRAQQGQGTLWDRNAIPVIAVCGKQESCPARCVSSRETKVNGKQERRRVVEACSEWSSTAIKVQI